MLIIGITGTLGAGKGTIVDYLEKKEKFQHFSVRGFIAEEIARRGLELNRDTLTLVANDLRANHSPSYIVDQLYEKAKKSGKNCIIESIRTPGEIDSLRKKGNFYLFAVDADAKSRYQRIVARASATDHIDFSTFQANEAREMNTDDPNKQNLRKCIEMADHCFNNDGTVEKLHHEVAKVLQKIKSL
jgi:dephospho-CoA kinase